VKTDVLPVRQPAPEVGLDTHLGAEERRWLPRVLDALEAAEVPCMLAGAVALFYHTGLWRGTKDVDLLILPGDRDRAVEAVCAAGMSDLFEQEPYDREWIFRSTQEGVIIDLIWRLANYQDDVQSKWFERAVQGEIFGSPVKVVSAADLCWMKLFVFQRTRCDWPDIINVIRGLKGDLDWDVLLQESGRHWRLLCALVDIYDWLCPPERDFIPKSFRRDLERLRREDPDAAEPCHNELFDSRPWLTDPGAGCPA
jgi:hypothetical protein